MAKVKTQNGNPRKAVSIDFKTSEFSQMQNLMRERNIKIFQI